MFWQLSVFASPEAEEAVSEILTNLFAKSTASYCDFETGKTSVSVYLEAKAGPTAEQKRALTHVLRSLHGHAPAPHARLFSVRRIGNRDWAHSWKLHFKPIEIGSRLLIKPSWSRRRAKAGQKVVILDPGLSFGTGQHPTTLFCLRHVVRMGRRTGKRSFLDIGTGSGILAIAAAKLGYSEVEAFDFDAKAVQIAGRNAKRNRVLHKIKLREQDVTSLPLQSRKKYSVICANLLANVLIQQRQRIANRLQPGGSLAVAGILTKEFPNVGKAYEKSGLKLISARTQGEWRSAIFFKKLNEKFLDRSYTCIA